MFKQIDPCASSKIIHNSQEKLVTINSMSRKRTLYVIMNQFKRFSGYMNARGKREPFLFCKMANITARSLIGNINIYK